MTKNVSRTIADFVASTGWDDLPAKVVHEAKRSLLNYVACAIAGSNEPAIQKTLCVMSRVAASGPHRIVARAERTDMLLAAYVNAASANIFDYDDTHQSTVIHPTAPVAPALFARAESRTCTGRELLRAFILGGEIECRVGNALSPSHYARGWHITSTCGVIGAALGAGALARLNVEQGVWAIGNAVAQAAGLVETLGTMSKSISVGNAARGGLLSALLAAEGYAGPPDPLAGARGFLRVYADGPARDRLTDGLGDVWEIATNTYKPYPAGIVLHPVIEACLRLRAEAGLRAEDIAEVTLTAHPLLRERADRPDVATGRLAQVSAQHAVAIALRRGKAGLAEFDDAAAAETLRDGIRPSVVFNDDPARTLEFVAVRITTRAGVQQDCEIASAKGGPRNPMTDAELEEKLRELAAYRGFNGDVAAIADAIWTLDTARDAAAVMRLASL